jgi:hypothetical protein
MWNDPVSRVSQAFCCIFKKETIMIHHPFARRVALLATGLLVAGSVQAQQPPGKPKAAKPARTSGKAWRPSRSSRSRPSTC